MRSKLLMFYFFVMVFMGCNNPRTENDIHADNHAVVDPLPSWNDGPTKEAIIAYVKKVTDSLSADFIPVPHRIATFDNDGTLWAERPYVQELFAFYRVSEMLKHTPALAKKQPFKAVIEKDKEYFSKGEFNFSDK